jgi:hypothetical protein
MIRCHSFDRDDTATSDPPPERTPDLTTAQLQAIMRALEDALAKSQLSAPALKPRVARRQADV